MTNVVDPIDLGEFEDEQAPQEPDKIMSAARVTAMMPKVKIEEMIAEVFRCSNDLEGAQHRLLLTGDRTNPHPEPMRRAAVLTAAGNFLTLIAKNKDAVARQLRNGAR